MTRCPHWGTPENTKELAAKEFMLEKDGDVMGIQESNVCWHKVRNTNNTMY